MSLALCLVSAASAARAEETADGARTLSRAVGVAEIAGEKVPTLLGAKEGELAVFAYKDGAFAPIPFQMDERDAEGTLILSNGEEAAESDDGGKLDANDLLVVEARAAGDRAPAGTMLAAALGAGCKKAVEIEVRHPKDGTRGWVYAGLWEGAPPRSPEDAVVYDPRVQSVDAREYRLRFDPEIPVGWNFLMFRDEDGGWTPNVLDRVKIHIHAAVLWGLVEADKSEEDIHLRILAWKDGPVRAVRRQATSMIMGLGLRSPETTADLTFMGDGLDQPIRIDLPFDPGGFFRDISWFIGLDFRGYEGAEWVIPNTAGPFKVDGKMDDAEESLDDEDREWMVIRHRSRAMIQRFKIEGGIPLTRKIEWTDDVEGDLPPEYVKGQVPRVGYRLIGWERIKAGRYFTRIQTMKVPHYEPGKEKSYVELLDVALEAREQAPAPVVKEAAAAAP